MDYKEAILEKTEGFPKNVYFLDHSGRLCGYIKEGTTLILPTVKPLQFDKRGRTFEKLTKKEVSLFDNSGK
jgi:hypothetical protein